MKNKNYLKLNLKFIFRLFSLLILAGAFSLNSFGQATQTFTTNGNFVVPAGVSTVQVEAWGGGGAGGGVTSSSNRGGGGGAGGTYTKNISVAVTPGASITVTVGAGGAGASSANGSVGGTSTFGSAVPVSAVGGGGGNVGNGTTNYGAGAGTATGITFNGGAGSAASSSTSNSGAGGGGAGSSGSGIAASGTTGGTGGAGGGGTGADGITSGSSDGTDATGLSAGGGGARGNSSNSSSRSGGNGSNGQVKVTWTCPSYTLTAASGVTPICNSGGGTSTITLTGSAAGLPAGAYTVTYNRSLPSATGLTAAMTVSVAGSGSFTATGLTTGGSSTITVTSLTSGAAGSTCSSTISANNAAVITVNAAPTISVQPSAQAICPGSPVTFSVTGNGTPSPTYQWRKVGVDISGATNASFNIASVSAGDIASYTVMLTNLCGSLTSSGAALTLNSAPSISVNPSPQTKCTGTSVTFSVSASGTPAPTYQWRKDGLNISGATSASYNIASVVTGSAADYDVVVTNTCGTAASTVATLTVNVTPAANASNNGPICSGNTLDLSSNSTGVTYSWSGPASFSSTLQSPSRPNALTTYSGTYTLTVTDIVNGCTASTTTGATVNSAPSISVHPSPQTRCTGTSVTFSATASGTPAPTYQWRKDGINISGATSASYNIASVVVGSAADYDVVVNNTCGNLTSNAATLTVNAAPAISVQPSAQTICSGFPVTFSVTGTGTPAPTYQWKKAGVNISGATNSSFNIASASAGDAASYTVVLTNTCNALTSNAAALTVNIAPSISVHPSSQTRCTGTSVTFSVTASGTAPTYQWRKDGVNISGATSASYNIASVVVGSAADYDVVVNNTCGNLTSNAATLTVNAAPAISVQPSAQAICSGFPVTFSVSGTGTPAPTYQWKKAGVNISGATNSSFNIASASAGDAASYTVVLTNTCNALTSNAAALTVNIAPAISVNPASQTKCTGTSVTFSVTASGTPAPTYQWRKDGVNISGATTASYNIASVVVGSAADYDVVVNNTCGNLTSNAATLTVNAAPAISVQPSAQAICSGFPVTFSVTGTGTPAPTYQWKKAGIDISGATNSSFNIASVSAGDAASYTVVLTNTCNVLTSNAAALTVNIAPAISVNPASQTKCTGTSVTFNASASGTPAPTYQWRKDGVNISGATTASYNIASVVVGSAAAYDVVVTNTCGTAASTAAALTVNVTPTANASNNGPICSGNTLNLSSNSTGVTYSWSGPASFSSTLQSPSRPNALTTYSGTYTITVTDIANGCTASITTGATVNATPATSASNNSAICAGSTLTLTGGPSSQTTYIWVGPNGYTSSSQSPSRSNAQTNYSGTYTLTVTSSAGCSASASTTATVNALPIASASNNGPVCQGSNLNLSASGGASYAWTGPNGYISTSQNPSITGVDGGDVGTYTVTVTQTGCTASVSTVLSSIKTLPVPAPAVTPGSVCSNSAVSLSSKQDVTARNVNDFSIPNVNSTGITSQIPISAFSPATLSAATIKSVAFNIDHTQTGDLEITLIAPGGSSILLVNNRGGSGDNFTNTTIVNSGGANGNVSAGSAPFTGTYNTETAFSGLTGNANGTWGLKVVDNNSSSNSGTLLNWTLTLVSNGVTYNWSSSPAGFSSALQNPTGNPSQNTTYTVDATLSGCIASGSVAVTTMPVPEPYAFTNAPICSASGLFLFGNNNAAGQTTGNTWSWKNPNNVVFSTLQNPSISNALVANSGVYTLTVTNSSGCTAIATTQVMINPNPVLSIGLQENVSCNGLSDASVDINANNGTSPYLFDLDGNATLDGIYSGLAAGNYTASVIDDNGCEAIPALTVTITQPAVLVASAASNSPACTGTSLIFTASQSGGTAGYSYLWTGPNNFNSTTQNPTINSATQILAGQYDLQITDANGCIASTNHTASIITAPTATISYNGPSSICLSQPANLQLTFTGTGPWTYIVNGPGGPYSGTTSNNPASITVTPSMPGQSDYMISSISDANCPLGGIATGTASVNAITAPPANTIGTLAPAALEACAGSVMMITVNSVGGQYINYEWNTGTNSSVVLFSNTISGPFSLPPFQTSSPFVYAQFGTLGSQSGYNVCVQAVNGCGNTNNRCTWIRGIVGVPGTITPSANAVACPNDVKSYACGLSGGATIYNWTLSGSSLPIISGQGTPNISVAFPSVFISGQLCVTASLACGGSSTSAPRCMTISNNPAIAAAISGPSKVCPGETGVAFSVPLVNGAISYNWVVPAGASIASGAGSNSITVNFPTLYTGAPNICVTSLGACGSSVARCKNVGTNLPLQPGAMTGPTTNICNSTAQYSIANVSGATSYIWSTPAGTTIISGQGSTTILLNVGSTFTSGQISVVASTSACSPGMSSARSITIHGKPNIPLGITANPGVWCSGSIVNFSTLAASPLPTYNWIVTNGIIDAGQGTDNIDVTWGLSAGGTANVSASNSCGVSGTRSQSFSSGCREEELLSNVTKGDFTIYPNPAHDKVTVSISARERANYVIKLIDMTGREMFLENVLANSGINTYEIDLNNFAKGVYMLEVQMKNEVIKKKVIIE